MQLETKSFSIMACRGLIIPFKHFTICRPLYRTHIVLCRSFSSLSVLPKITYNRLSYTCPSLSQSRNYPKGKERVKGSGKKVEIREDMLAEYINVTKLKKELADAIHSLKEQYIQNVSLRSSAGAIESLQIEFEGEKYTLRDLAQINRKNPKVLALNFSMFPQTIPVALQVINDSSMNLSPQQDGTSVFIPIPKVTREHRENLAKSANALFNKCKVNIRDVQSMYMKKLEAKQDDGLSMALFLILREQIAQIVSNVVTEAEKMKNDKIKELLGDG